MLFRIFSRIILMSVLILKSTSFCLNCQCPEINYGRIDRLIGYCDSTGADKIAIYHNNSLVRLWSNIECDSLYMNTASMVKSWLGILTGILIEKEIISGENDKVSNYIPEWSGKKRDNVRIRHLLNMSSGILKKPAAESVLATQNVNDFVLSLVPDTAPRSLFSYSNEGVQLLGILIERASGMEAAECFNKYLFKPLGMDSTFIYRNKKDESIVFGGCRTTLQDASKPGLLVLNEGRINNKRVVSKEWIEKMLEPQSCSPFYGYLWWLNTEDSSIAAMGDFGQLTIIYPEKKLLFLRQQSCNKNDSANNMSFMKPEFFSLLRNIIPEKNNSY